MPVPVPLSACDLCWRWGQQAAPRSRSGYQVRDFGTWHIATDEELSHLPQRGATAATQNTRPGLPTTLQDSNKRVRFIFKYTLFTWFSLIVTVAVCCVRKRVRVPSV